MIHRHTSGTSITLLFCALLAGPLHAEFSLIKLHPTKLQQLPETATLSWNLGPTGMRGWVVGAKGDSIASREILVDHIQKGQGASGSWGHSPATNGQTKGYGEVNSVGLPCLMTLALAKESGVKVKPENYERARNFFRRYSGIGSIPYGDHQPWLKTYGANGKNAAAAVALMLTGDADASRFFSHMTASSTDEREIGHTGNFFSYLWGPVGVGLAGDTALADFLKPQRWYYDLARQWDGSFITQPWPHKAEGPNAMNNYVSRGPIACTPSVAMAYAVPLKKLRMFGAKAK